MKSFLFAALLALAGCATTTTTSVPGVPVPEPEMGRPAFAVVGKETMPMMWIDEAALPSERFARIPFPADRWAEEKSCLGQLGQPVDKIGDPPDILVIPAVRTIRVHDMTVDSLLSAEDSMRVGEYWAPPTIGYSLVKSNFILVTAPYQQNPYVLRHEALHFMLWRQSKVLAHPKEFFEPCDAHFNPQLGIKPNNDW